MKTRRIGFLGAGVIMREGLTVRGLNTAATLWCSAAVGTLSGSGQTKLALVGTIGVLLANFGLRPLARLIDRQPTEPDTSPTDVLYLLRLVCRSEGENHARALPLHQRSRAHLHEQLLGTIISCSLLHAPHDHGASLTVGSLLNQRARHQARVSAL